MQEKKEDQRGKKESGRADAEEPFEASSCASAKESEWAVSLGRGKEQSTLSRATAAPGQGHLDAAGMLGQHRSIRHGQKLSPENKDQKWRREANGRAVLHHFEMLDTTTFPAPPRSADDVRMGEEMEDEEAEVLKDLEEDLEYKYHLL